MSLSINNIDGIENATNEEIKKLGNEAFKEYVNLFNTPFISKIEFNSKLEWYTKVFHKCAILLKKRSVITLEQHTEIMEKFYNTHLIKGGK